MGNSKQDFKKVNKVEKPMQELKVEKLTATAKLPIRGHEFDAGLDIFSDEETTIVANEHKFIKTGIKMSVPENYVALVWDKGGISKKGVHTLAGVVDAGYLGEVMINLANLTNNDYKVETGQKIAQILIQKVELPKVVECKIEENTDRGEKGFGSTGLY